MKNTLLALNYIALMAFAATDLSAAGKQRGREYTNAQLRQFAGPSTEVIKSVEKADCRNHKLDTAVNCNSGGQRQTPKNRANKGR